MLLRSVPICDWPGLPAILMSALRIKNYIKQISIDEERVEQFISRRVAAQDPQKIIGGAYIDVPLELEEHQTHTIPS